MLKSNCREVFFIMNTEPKVYVIVLNYNGWEDTVECISSILKNSYINYQIVIVDNGSTDNSVFNIIKWINERNDKNRDISIQYKLIYYKNDMFMNDAGINECVDKNIPIIIIVNDKNSGYAGGNNVGIRYILNKNDSEYTFILNNDTIIENNAIKHLVEMANSNSNFGVIGCTIMEYYKPNIVQSAGGACYNHILTINKNICAGLEYKDLFNFKIRRIDYISGCAMFVRNKIFKEIGLLNEDYFLYYEEIDFAKRLKDRGYELGWSKKSLIYHKNGASTGSRSIINKKSKFSEYHSNLSALIFTRKYYPKLILPIMLIRLILKMFKFIFKNEYYLFIPLFVAYYDFILKSFKGEY